MYFQILYVTATGDPQPAVLEGKIPFEEMVYTDGGEMESYFIQNIRVEFTVSLVHSRKLSVRAMVEIGDWPGKAGGRRNHSGYRQPGSDLQKNEKCKPPGASYHQKGHLPDQGRNYASWNKGKRRAAAFDGRQQQEAGDPPGSG